MVELTIEPIIYGIYKCPAEWIVNEQGTLYHRLYYAYEGEARYKDSSFSFPLEKGHLYLFPVNKPYNITHNPGCPFMCLYFHITTHPLILNPVMDIDTLKSPVVFQMIKAIEHTLQHPDKYPDNSSLLRLLLNSLMGFWDSEEPLRFVDESRLQKVLEHIHENSGEKLTNSDLAKVAGFDRFYFARLFRKSFGVSPQQYIFNNRIIKAEGLIRKSIPIKNVAALVGFQDEKAFSRAFKKAKGCPPSRYIKSHSLQP